jgi:hypothetical protein
VTMQRPGTANRNLSRRRFTPVVELGCRQLTYPLLCAPSRRHRLRPEQWEASSPKYVTLQSPRRRSAMGGFIAKVRHATINETAVGDGRLHRQSTSRYNQRDGGRLVGAEAVTPPRGALRGRRVAGLGEFDDRCETSPRQISIRCAPVVELSPMPYRPRASRRRRGSSVSPPSGAQIIRKRTSSSQTDPTPHMAAL